MEHHRHFLPKSPAAAGAAPVAVEAQPPGKKVRRTWLAFAVVLLLALSAPSSPEARPYGAIAYDDKTGAWGVAYNQASEAVAKQRALAACAKRGPNCDLVVRFWGEACAAYATGAGKAAGWGSGDTRASAERNAVVACHREGQRCEPRAWSCNTRTGGNEAFSPTRMCHFWDSAAQSYVTRPCSSR
jgi:hypothetical protein